MGIISTCADCIQSFCLNILNSECVCGPAIRGFDCFTTGEDCSLVSEEGRCSFTDAARESSNVKSGKRIRLWNIDETVAFSAAWTKFISTGSRREMSLVVVLMPLCTIFLSVASVNTGFRVKYVLPYQNLPSCHSKNSQLPPSMKWKRAHHQRIWLQLMKITLHQHDTQTLFDWLKII